MFETFLSDHDERSRLVVHGRFSDKQA